MHANYDSPGVQSTNRSAGQIGGKAFWTSPVAKPAFFIGPHGNCGLKVREVSIADSRPRG
jgi:hypothetical protein